MNSRLLVAFCCIALAGHALAATNATQSITLRDCIERALAQNLDLQIERLNPGIAQWGVVAAQGAFDPTLTGSVNYQDATEPLSPERAAALGLSSLNTKDLGASAGLTGLLPPGTRYNLTAFSTRESGTLTTNFVYTGTAGIALTQPLLKNFGFGATTAPIRVARKSRQIAEQNLAQQVMQTITGVHNAYYELVYAIENLKAAREDLDRARALLDENRKRLQIGTMSELDVTQAEAGAAEREEAVIVAEQLIRTNENALKRLIARDVTEWRDTSLVPVDYPVVEMIETDRARSTRTALEQRPDFLAARHETERQDILVRYSRNQLWPEIDLQGSYGLNGRSGTGFGDFVDNTADADSPVWSVGVTATFPLGDRAARGSYRQARLQSEQSLLALKRLEQQIIVEVDNAIGEVETNRKRVDATAAARRLAEESLKAEEAKLRAGSSTSFLVLQAQSQLAAARSAEIRARSDYAESIAALAQADGTTLDKHNISLDAKY